MGYKRAGFKVLGNCEIDPRMNEIYLKNLHPRFNFLMDLREFNKLDNLPEELYHLDILDGSPPCSTFSTAGAREKGWGVEKTFREGQKKQRLDDLFFVFLDTVEKLRPKVVVAENVTGLLKGNAKGYVNEIIKRFHELGYNVQIFNLNSAYMDCPQKRERVFFIANNQKFPRLKLEFNNKLITFGEIRSEHGKKITGNDTIFLLSKMITTDHDLRDINLRVRGKNSRFNEKILHDKEVPFTLCSGGNYIRAFDKTYLSDEDYRRIQTFPYDYDFGKQNLQYICGMSVPPNMMANIATEIYKQWFKK